MRTHWPPFGLYLKHLGIAWPGLLLATGILSLLLGLTPANFLFDFPSSAPYFAGYWVVGFVAGYWFNRHDRTRAAYWVWIPAWLIFISDARADLAYAGWANIWVQEFSRNCASSECLGELIGTAPLITCVMYSVGAWWARRRGPAPVRTNAQPAPDGSHA